MMLIGGVSGGCYAERIPEPSPREARFLQHGPLPYHVLVVPWDAAAGRSQNPQAYARGTFEWLKSSGAFLSVRLADSDAGAADLTATPLGVYCNRAIVPLWTILTLGVVPTIFSDAHCEGAVFRAAGPGGAPADSVIVRQRVESRVIMGWLAAPAGALPGWTHGSGRTHARYRDRSRATLLARARDFARLVGR